MNMALLIPIIAIAGSFCMVIAVVAINARSTQRRTELRTEVQTKLIDKFGSAPEMIGFLQSPAGREFVGNMQSGPIYTARDRIDRSIRQATVMLFLGAAFCAAAYVLEEHGMFVPGFILLGLGLAYTVSIVVSHYVLKSSSNDRDGRSSSPDLMS